MFSAPFFYAPICAPDSRRRLSDINHLHGHAAVQDDVLTGHEISILGDEPAGLGHIFGNAHPSHRMLLPVRPGMMRWSGAGGLLPIAHLDPSRTCLLYTSPSPRD